MNLTQQQKIAAHSPAPVTLCPAGAGSGKTKVLVERARWLLDPHRDSTTRPEQLCIVTFTQSAALELRSRLDAQVSWHISDLGHCSTLHSLLLKLLRRHGALVGLPAEITVMSEEEADAALLGIATSLKVKASMKAMKERVAFLLQHGGTGGVGGKESVVAQEFVRTMKQTGELSYDALLALGYRLIASHPEVAPFRHALIDEGQDSAAIDWKIYEAMRCETKFYCSDFRQKIYSFRNGPSDGFERMMADPGVTLCPISTNFRSSKAVVRAANNLLPHQEPRPDAPEGSVTLRRYGSAAEEIASVAMQIQALPADSTVAVLFRTNKAADLFRAGLLPFGLAAEAPRPEAKGEDEKLAVAMLRAMCAPHNDRAVLNFLTLSMGIKFANDLKAHAAEIISSVGAVAHLGQVQEACITDPDELPDLAFTLYPQARSRTKDAVHWLQHLATQLPLPCTLGDLLLLATQPETEHAPSRIETTTIHQMKGREKDFIFLPAFEDEVMPGRKTGEELAEELRLAYVAVTRAKLEVHMSYCAERPNDYKPWQIEKRTPSRFAVMAMGDQP